uniref:uncharacterized protein LOC120326428 n=1 Tax=Styela clava TaxID=7725 RepID=UPI001939BEF3|nr:uncharacterized protein LOC120326428 [Styela clava]
MLDRISPKQSTAFAVSCLVQSSKIYCACIVYILVESNDVSSVVFSIDAIIGLQFDMDDKPDLKDRIVKEYATEATENLIKANSGKISASPLVQGFIFGYVCARFPVGLFMAAGVGFLSGLYLEENFMLPDLKEKVLSIFPEQRDKE